VQKKSFFDEGVLDVLQGEKRVFLPKHTDLE
jgi:hypothetical protein